MPRLTLSRLNLPAALLAALIAAPAMAEAPRVITDIPPVHALAAMVMEGVGTPELLLDRGASPHHAQLRPSQASALAEADALFWVGPSLTPWLDRAMAVTRADVALRLDLVPGLHVQDYGGGDEDHAGHDHDHADHDHEGHDHDHDHEGHDHEGHDHSGADPHLWLDPGNARLWLGAIRDRLTAIDPDHASAYAANAQKADAELAALDARIAAELAPAKGKHFAVFHDAYGYFTTHYGLEPALPVLLGDAAPASAGRLADLRNQMAAGNVVCAFPEAQHDPKLIAQLTEGTAVRTGAPLDPAGSSLTPGAGLYGELLGGIAQALTGCLGE